MDVQRRKHDDGPGHSNTLAVAYLRSRPMRCNRYGRKRLAVGVGLRVWINVGKNSTSSRPSCHDLQPTG